MNDYTITSSGLIKYVRFSEEIYVKENENSEPIFFTRCMLDTDLSPGKSCTIYEQFDSDTALYYFIDKRFANDSYIIDLKLRALITSFLK